MAQYLPAPFLVEDPRALQQLIQSSPLGCWIISAGGELIANHLPWHFEAGRGPHGTLLGHVARANPVWQSIGAGVESLVVFQGPSAYISPSWYRSKQEQGRVVPTWNYAVVHVYGQPEIIDDPHRLRVILDQLTDRHESELDEPWSVSDAPAEYVERLMQAIVGIEIPVARMVGKWKLSQNRSIEDRRGVISGLRRHSSPQGSILAALMEAGLADDGGELS